MITTRTLKNKYKKGGGVKSGRPCKKENYQAKQKRLRLEEAAAREAQTSKLRSSANDTTDVPPVVHSPPIVRKSSLSVCKSSSSARKVPPSTRATRSSSRAAKEAEKAARGPV